jgi:type I restriction enzyme S subunit
MEGFKEYRLGDICNITSSKRIFYDEYVSMGVPFYRSKEIIEKADGKDISTELFITEEKFREIKLKFGVPIKGDILLTSVGTLGISYLVKENDWFYFKDGNLTWLKEFANDVDSKFLLYWFRSSIGKESIDNITIGSTQSAITIAGLKSIRLLLPPIDIQQRTVEILEALDGKIELNRLMNQTLEQMAVAFYKHYFVDGIDQENLPDGWRKGRLGDITIRITKGTTPTTLKKQFVSSGINFIKVESITDEGDFLFDKFNFIDGETHQLLNRSQVQENDILFTIAGTLGKVGFVTKEVLPANTNQAVAIIRPDYSKTSSSFIYYFVKDKSVQQSLLTKTVQGVQANLSLSVLSDMEVMIPDFKYLTQNSIEIDELIKLIQNNNIETRNLQNIRNTILPKLISGILIPADLTAIEQTL